MVQVHHPPIAVLLSLRIEPMLARSPRHRKAAAYAGSTVFRGLKSFSDLERNIEQLPTEQERGAAFEVFVEAYLSLDETVQASDVWVGGQEDMIVDVALDLLKAEEEKAKRAAA